MVEVKATRGFNCVIIQTIELGGACAPEIGASIYSFLLWPAGLREGYTIDGRWRPRGASELNFSYAFVYSLSSFRALTAINCPCDHLRPDSATALTLANGGVCRVTRFRKREGNFLVPGGTVGIVAREMCKQWSE